ncbi:energy transducer TonB, partial [bacterium]|nr:energy transducer TonB [bacterium]
IMKHLKPPKVARDFGNGWRPLLYGTVFIRTLVGKDGKPEIIEVEKHFGNLDCNEAAVEAVKNIRFTPAVKDGKPVKFWFKIPVEFALSDLPIEDQPKIIGGYASIMKHLKYPEIAKKAGIEGTVIVRSLIGKDGKPEKVEVAEGFGNPECNNAALKALRNMRFIPATKDGKPVRFWFSTEIRFQNEWVMIR